MAGVRAARARQVWQLAVLAALILALVSIPAGDRADVTRAPGPVADLFAGAEHQPIVHALVSLDGRTVTVAGQADRCGRLDLTATETLSAVFLTLRRGHGTATCGGATRTATACTALRTPLHGRVLRDTTSGALVRYATGAPCRP